MGVKSQLGSLIGTVADEAARVAITIQPSEIGKTLLQTGGKNPGFYIARAVGTGRRYWSRIDEPDNPWLIWGVDLLDWKDTFDGVGVSYLLNGGDVSSWTDHSDLAFHEVQATAINQPTLGVGVGPNGHDEIAMPDGSTEYLRSPSLAAVVLAGSRPHLYVAGRGINAAAGVRYIAGYLTAGAKKFVVGSDSTDRNVIRFAYDTTSFYSVYTATSTADALYHAWEAGHSVTVNTFRKDGAKPGLTMDAPTTAFFNAGTALGADYSVAQTGDHGTQSGGGIIARVGVKRTPTANEHRRFTDWMRYHTNLNFAA